MLNYKNDKQIFAELSQKIRAFLFETKGTNFVAEHNLVHGPSVDYLENKFLSILDEVLFKQKKNFVEATNNAFGQYGVTDESKIADDIILHKVRLLIIEKIKNL